jgi:hypothetical protein
MKSGFSTDFSMVRSPNRVLTPLKSASFEIRILSFVAPSKIFVWEGYHCKVNRSKHDTMSVDSVSNSPTRTVPLFFEWA